MTEEKDYPISIICIYNNPDLLNTLLIPSLRQQTIPYELILIDNQNQKYSSAAKLLNDQVKFGKGKYLLFLHQDIELCKKDFLEKIIEYMDGLPGAGIAGVAGCSPSFNGIISNIYHGVPKKPAGSIFIKTPTRVQTVDECCFVIPNSFLKKYPFNENICQDWHLYAVEYSLHVLELGLQVYVLPLKLYHRSDGIYYSNAYFKSLNSIQKKYGKKYSVIYTTVGKWSSSPIIFQKMKFLILFAIQKLLVHRIKREKCINEDTI